MEPLAVALILISAASHAAWNYLAKGSRDKDSFMLLINLTSQVTLLPVFILVLKDWSLPVSILPFIIISAIAEAAYFLALSRAYDAGDLSVVYPVARSAPLFVAVVGALFLGDPLTVAGITGILLVLLGVYILHLKSLRLASVFEPLHSFRGPAFGFALIAALGTTAYSLSDQAAVTHLDPVQYDFWLEIAITLVLTPIILQRRGLGNLSSEWGRHLEEDNTIRGADEGWVPLGPRRDDTSTCGLPPRLKADQRRNRCPPGRCTTRRGLRCPTPPWLRRHLCGRLHYRFVCMS